MCSLVFCGVFFLSFFSPSPKVVFLYELCVSFKGLVLISNWCSIPNNIKAPVKLEPYVTNKAINYYLPMKTVSYIVTLSSSNTLKLRSKTENPVTFISKKDSARIVNTLLKVKLQVMALKPESLLERNVCCALFSENLETDFPNSC